MAASVSDVVVRFLGESGDFDATIRNVNDGFSKFDSNLKSVSAPAANLTKTFLATEAALVALATAFVAYGVKEASKFADATAELNKVLGDDLTLSLKEAQEESTKLSEKYGVAAAEILESAANFKQSGYTTKEAMQLAKDGLDLVIAGGVDANTASQILISSLKGMKAPASSAGRYLEALNNTSAKYATSVKELASGMGDLSPALAKLGFSFEDGIGLLTPIIEIFGSGSEAANAMKIGLLNLIDPSKLANENLAKLGVTQRDSNGEMKTGKQIFKEVATAISGMDEKQQLANVSMLFGKDHALKLVNVFTDLAKAEEITANAMEKTGSVLMEVETALGLASKKADVFKVSFNNLSKEIGDKFLEKVGGILDGTSALTQAFRDVIKSGGLDGFFEGLDPILKDFDETLKGIAKALPEAFEGVDFDIIIKAFKDLGGEVGGIFDELFGSGLDLTKPKDLTIALQKIIDIIATMVKVTQGIIQEFKPIFTLIGKAADEMKNANDGTALSVGKLLGALTLLEDFGLVTGGIMTTTTNAGGDIKAVFDVIAGAVKLFINGLHTSFLELERFVAEFLIDFNETLASVSFGETSDNAKKDAEKWKKVLQDINNDVRQNGEDVKKAWSQMVDGVSGENDKAVDSTKKMGEDVNKSLEKLQDDAGSVKIEFGVGEKGSFDAKVKELTDKGVDFQQEWDDKVGGKILRLGDLSDLEDENNAIDKSKEKTKELVAVKKDITEAHKEEKKAIKEVTEEVGKLTEAQKLGIENSHDLKKTILDNAADISKTRIEVDAEIKIEKFKAQAETAKSIMEGVAASIESTSQASADMFDSFANALTSGDLDTRSKWDLEKVMDRQMDLQEKAIEIEEKFVDAQVEKLEAETRALESGENELRFVFDESVDAITEDYLTNILSNIRVLATGEGLGILRGTS